MIKNIVFTIITMFVLLGCSKNESIFVPGKTQSDCEENLKNLGVCGTPLNVYAHRDKIKNLWFEEGESYYIKSNGKIYNIDTKEEVLSGVKPSDDAICPSCDEEDIDDMLIMEDGNNFSISKKKKGGINLKNRAFVLKTPQKTTMIRDLGWQQKIWIAPLKTKYDDLIEAHGIHVVIKEPSWIIGEETPRKVNRGVTISSPFAKELLTDNHQSIDKKAITNIYNYVGTQKRKNLGNIEKYVKKQKQKKDIKNENIK